MEPTLNQVVEWAKAAGKIALDGFQAEHTIGFKGATDLVTEVDHACETLIMAKIKESFPTHAIITEETGVVAGDQAHRWHIDPLDGTVNYSHRVPIYAVSIAYELNGEVQLGVVYDPSRDECFAAERGKGAWLNGETIRVSRTRELQQSLLSTGFPHHLDKTYERHVTLFGDLTLNTHGVVRLGSAAIVICYVACGRFDGYWEMSINSWDIAAGALICLEAGATVTNAKGEMDFFKPPYDMLVATPGVHAALLAKIRAAFQS
jgi:myo-inositol-1(or 4)-monophosphatase